MIGSMRMTAILMLLLVASATSQPLEETLHARIADFPGAFSIDRLLHDLNFVR